MASRLERPKMVKRTRSESREKNKKPKKEKRKKHRSPRRDRRSSEDLGRGRTKSESKYNREYPSSKPRSPHSRERTREGSPYRQRYKDGGRRQDYQSSERKLRRPLALNYERYELNDERSSSDHRTRRSLEVEIDKMLATEQHHTQRVGHRSSGEINDVIWCPRYISPDIKHHVRGGESLLHHRCRSCRQLCYHLLGRPGTKRLCLQCSGWKKRYIPEWYFHKRCKYCY